MRLCDKYLAECSPSDFSEAEYLRAVADSYSFSPKDLLAVLNTTEGRRQATKSRPLLWALIYAREAIQLKNGPHTGEVTMNDLSLDFFRNLYEWTRPNDIPGQRRVCEIAPRESGKSQLLARILPTYLLTTSDSKEFICIFASSHPKSKERMQGIRKLLNSPLLRDDYPDIQPAKRGGFSESDTMQRLKMGNGSVLFCSGITSTAISGLLDDDLRVTCSILDDISPSGGGWAVTEEQKRLQTLREVIYDLGKFQRLFFVGTTVAYNSLVHQMLMNASNEDHWSIRDKWDVRHHLPITSEIRHDGQIVQHSFWPHVYSVEYLNELRATDDRLFALNWQNDPMSAGDGSYWTPELIIEGKLPTVSKRIISIDPGIATKKTSDPTGITVASMSLAAKKACIDEAFEIKAKSVDLKRVILSLKQRYPDIDTLLWEDNQGGEQLANSVLGHDFAHTTGIRVVLIHAKESKMERAELLLSRYKQRQILHNPDSQLKDYESELMAAPFWVRSPNTLDSAGYAIEYLSKARI